MINGKLSDIRRNCNWSCSYGGSKVYGTQNQQNYIPKDAIPAPAAEQGAFSSPSGLGAQLNKEKWHQDPFGDIAAKVREQAGK